MKSLKKIAVLTVAATAVLSVGSLRNASAATTATAGATLSMDNFASVSSSGAFTLTPGQAEFEANAVEQTGAVTLNVVTNNTGGCTVSVAGEASPTLKNSDLLIKVPTAGVLSGFATYAPLPDTETPLWETTEAQPSGTNVSVDVRVQNLRTYAGGTGGAGNTADYTNTLTFSVLPNS